MSGSQWGSWFRRALQTRVLGRTLSTLTTVDQVFHRELGRWLTAIEKLSIMGFCALPGVSQAYEQEPCSIVSCCKSYSIEQVINYPNYCNLEHNHTRTCSNGDSKSAVQ